MSISKMVEQVTEFHKAFGLPIADKPHTCVDLNLSSLRHSLILEEVNELYVAQVEKDLSSIADGICDCIYVLMGTAITYGLGSRLEEIFDEVHRSNMSKLVPDGSVLRREDGKVLKGPLFTPPDLKKILGKKYPNVQKCKDVSACQQFGCTGDCND
jgi:predicted HAD superfamily Cof-like phosphohydrolase